VGAKKIICSAIAAVCVFALPVLAMGADTAPPAGTPPHADAPPHADTPPHADALPHADVTSQPETDPLAPINEPIFRFNIKLDEWVLRPVASGWATVMPQPARVSVGRFFDNVAVIPRFANNAFQLKMPEAGGEVGRFLINSTAGVAGFFDPADEWFGMKEHDTDFGLTMRHYGVGEGAYLMLPFFGPSTIRDTVGRVADGAMNPMSYLLPWYISFPAQSGATAASAVNYRSLNLTLFEDVDRYAVDLYGAVQDGYLQRRRKSDATTTF
jgi:phospholipid-binding lipoprotein MlaA